MTRFRRAVLWLASAVVGLRNPRLYLLALLAFAALTGIGLRLISLGSRSEATAWAFLQSAAGAAILVAEVAFVVLAIRLLVHARREDADRPPGRHSRSG